MNIEQAKAIPLSVILDKMGQKPQRTTKKKACYFSPYRKEKTPSFYIFTDTNRWFDYGDNQGGDVVDLVALYLESCGVSSDKSSALRWTRNMVAWQPVIPVQVDDCYNGSCEGLDETLVLRKTRPIEQKALVQYGESRGVPPSVLKKYLEEVYFFNRNTGKSIFALGMKNESKGYDFRNQKLKGCLRKKDVTHIRGTEATQTAVHVFEGMFDFLTVLTQREGRPMKDDSIILHSLTCMEKGAALIRGYGYQICHTWFDNDEPGQKATQAWAELCSREDGLKHTPMNNQYKPYKDVNAAHIAKLELA